MKKILLTAAAATMLIVACSKDDNPVKPVDPTVEIKGDWTGASYEMTGFINGVAIEQTNKDQDELVKTLNLTLFKGTETADSIKGTYGTDSKSLLGTYVVSTTNDTTRIDAKLTLSEDQEFAFAGDVNLTSDSLIVTKGIKGDVEFGDQTADSTSTVVKFVRKK
ncbi:hypothetical protein SAMN05192529_12641 [Arachidicoccus rhizosphaerae]|jgi:hypothetical protein|uniref:Uncharacterized protein n=1 Tax=Arachidicoccus rhizosphaerae TaxID=551991 RepID=A0A1H4C1H9_9BACT|nr:hypothetical protein [Arachidicoccus rhizosphaerae]SEA54173.1 hypothetical protein SAMN05192529_12641 [Arachidicoccus rhizosphaerae]